MLIVRPAQLEAFQPQADAAFEMQVVEYLQEEHGEDLVQIPTGVLTIEQPSIETLQEKNEDDAEQLPAGVFSVEQLPDEILLEMVRNGIARARSYGMSWESSLTAFVVLMLVTAPSFDKHPLIRRVLRDKEVEPDERIDHLWEKTSEANWETVGQNYDSSAWGIKPKGETKKGASHGNRENAATDFGVVVADGGTAAPADAKLELISPALPDGTAGQEYNPGSKIEFRVSGGKAGYKFEFDGTPPDGLTISAGGIYGMYGVIGGMPKAETANQTFEFGIKVTDAAGRSVTSEKYRIKIACPTIKVSRRGTLPDGREGKQYKKADNTSVAMTVNGGTGSYNFELTGTPPPGLKISSEKKELYGAPEPGSGDKNFKFRVKVTDAVTGCSAESKEYDIYIAAADG